MPATKLTKESLIESLKEMNLMEVNELVKALEEEFGVSANMAVMMTATSGAGGEDAAEEKTEFDIVLKSSGDKKIQVIKDVREITGLGLKEAKNLVDNGGKVVEGVNINRAKEVKEKLEASGAVVEMK